MDRIKEKRCEIKIKIKRFALLKTFFANIAKLKLPEPGRFLDDPVPKSCKTGRSAK